MKQERARELRLRKMRGAARRDAASCVRCGARRRDDLHRVGAAGLAHRLADGEHDEVAVLAPAPLATSRSSAARSTRVAVVALLEIERVHVAVERHLALRSRPRGERVDRQPQLWRDIHSAVEPDSVSAAIAFT